MIDVIELTASTRKVLTVNDQQVSHCTSVSFDHLEPLEETVPLS